MTHWLRFEHAGAEKFGSLQDDIITVCSGDMFNDPQPTSETLSLNDIKLLTPTRASKMVCLWNNYHAMAAKQDLTIPEEPLYLIKPSTSFITSGDTIKWPAHYDGKVFYEGELGIVIGKNCKDVSERDASDYIFGYTCVNDVTAFGLLKKDPSFDQWTRAKGFDTFGVYGPVVATGLNPTELVIKAILNGRERQNYPVSDIIFPPAKIVSAISEVMTLLPGDIIACGTSLGILPMKSGSTVEISIDGIGILKNVIE